MNIENAVPTNQFRFLEKQVVFEAGGDIHHQTSKVLQQAWYLTPADGSKPYMRTEWRDVPTVRE